MKRKRHETIADYLESEIRMLTKLIDELILKIIKQAQKDAKAKKMNSAYDKITSLKS